MSTNNNVSLTTKLAALFGRGAEISAHVVETGTVTFFNTDTRNLWETILSDDIVFGVFNGPGRYKVTIGTGELLVTVDTGEKPAEPAMKPAQFVLMTDEAVGNPESGATLTAIFRQLLKDNNINEAELEAQVDTLLDKFPSPSVGREKMKEHVMTKLVENELSWEAFVIGMKIVGASQITIAVR